MNETITQAKNPVPTAPYLEQSASWPQAGEHILAHFDEETIVVYQAYRPEIGRFAIEHGYFGGEHFSLGRMSWIKPNFLWMMYRSDWASKEGQEITLGLRLRRSFFEALLERAVPSSFGAAAYSSRETWQSAVADSDVRLQWDPDHSPSGAKLERRAIQIGLRGRALEDFAQRELLEVIDLTAFVDSQRQFATDDSPALITPVERVYPRGTGEADQSTVSPRK